MSSYLQEAIIASIDDIPEADYVKDIDWSTMKHWMWPKDEKLDLARQYLQWCGYTILSECSCKRAYIKPRNQSKSIADNIGDNRLTDVDPRTDPNALQIPCEASIHHHFITCGSYSQTTCERQSWRDFVRYTYKLKAREYNPKIVGVTFDSAIKAKCQSHAANMLFYCFKQQGTTTCRHFNPITYRDFGFHPHMLDKQATNFKQACKDKHLSPAINPHSFMWESISVMKAWGLVHSYDSQIFLPTDDDEWIITDKKCNCTDSPVFKFKGHTHKTYKRQYYTIDQGRNDEEFYQPNKMVKTV